MLFTYGKTIVENSWGEKEISATLFSRIYYMLNGTAIFRDDTGVKTLKKRHLYCLPTNKPYELSLDENAVFEVLYLHVDIAPYVLDHLVEIFVENGSFLESMLVMGEKYCDKKAKMLNSALTESVFLPLVEYLKAENTFSLHSFQIEKTVSYIVQNLEKSLLIEDLSIIAGYHPQHYIRLFKKATGTTPHQFILQYRMKTGYQYLWQGKTVEETSALVGFDQAKNFSRTFKSYFGILPSKVQQERYGLLSI